MSRLWVYKCNSRQHDAQIISFGDWARFFAHDGPWEWGSTRWSRSNMSRKIIREEMHPGDLFLAWQSDRREALGLGRVVNVDPLEDNGSVEWDLILEPVERFDPPFPLLDIRASDPELAAVAAFRQGPISTLYRTTPEEAAVLLDRCGASAAATANRALRRSSRGGRFGMPETNKVVEKAAVDLVTQDYVADGWTVESVEADRVGYDLHATKGRQEHHVEVKGVSGPDIRFVFTAGELSRAQGDKRWLLAVVTNARTTAPQLAYLSGDEVDSLARRPIAYSVTDEAVSDG
jgi:hypothetical protein